MLGGWIERWLSGREPPLGDIGALYGVRRKGSAFGANLWLIGQLFDFAVNVRALRHSRRKDPSGGVHDSQKGWGGMDGWMGDLRVAVRGMFRRRGWALAVLATLALGTGAATGLFSVTYAVLARPLPYPAADRLVRVFPANPDQGVPEAAFSMPDWEDWRSATRQLDELALYSTLPSDLVLTGYGSAMELETVYVTSGFFETLGVAPALGRTLRPEEERGDNRVVVLSNGAWERVFGGDPSVVGTTILLKTEPYRIVGVMPPGFGFPTETAELYTFLTVIPPSSTPLHLRVVRFLEGVGRLAPQATLEGAQSELSAIAAGLSQTHPDTNGSLTAATVRPLHEMVVGNARPALLALLIGAVLFLLAACANVAGLMLVRQSGREAEYRLRASLGASRARLARQALVESGVMALLGTALGLGVATGVTRFLVGRSGALLPRASEVAVDGPAFLFAAVLVVCAAGLVGLLPARFAVRVGEPGARRKPSPDAMNPRSVLVAAQVGLATVILIAAGLMIRSLGELGRVDPGFAAEGRLVAMVNISSGLYPEREDYLAFYRAYRSELAALPGVEAVGSIRYFPTRGVGETYRWQRPGFEPDPDELQQAFMLQVDAGLPEALGMRLRAGRLLADTEEEGPAQILINRTLARAAFGDGDGVGETLLIDDDYPVEVVGVVDDVLQRGLGEEADPTIYMHQASNPRRSMAFVLRTNGDPLALVGPVRNRLQALDPDQPIAELTTADQVLSGSLAPSRFLALMGATFGALSTLLAIVGAAGTVASAAGRRRREIGIRIALGELPRSVSLRMLRGGFWPIGAGLVGGAAVALGFAGLLRGLLFGVAPRDWIAVVAAMAVLGFFSLVACYIPARRAGAVDPASAMRME